MSVEAAPPRAVRVAGVLVGLQGLTGVGFAVALLILAVTGTVRPGDVLGEAGYFTLLSAGVLAVAVGLLRGRRWARTPAIVVQLLLLGVAWYTLGPSSRPLYGLPLGAYCIVVVVLLLTAQSREWAMGVGRYAGPETEQHSTDQ